jgi:hypothetical protein
MRVYQKGGAVDTLFLPAGSAISHSLYDLYGRLHDDYVTMLLETTAGERRYAIEEVDSMVLPNGRRVVFHAGVKNAPGTDGRKRSSFSGVFPGTGKVTFYWTENDRISLDAGYESRAERLTPDKTGAEFVFDGADLYASSYQVYYPGKGVTIPAVQTQTGANNSDHIGQSGDCGVATATLNEDDGSYSFTLQHKAAYLCFLPHIDYLPSARVKKIEVQCSQPIAGNYQLSKEGLYAISGTSKKITLNLNTQPQKPNDFLLAHQIADCQDACAAYMVIAPQTSSCSFTVTYHVTDTLSRFYTTYVQTFNLKPVANTVYPISCKIPESLFRSIDLGFDHLWSNVNLGSNLPNEPGNYYAWGETTPRLLFAENDYTTRIGKDTLNISATKYDAANTAWGSSWQMPTEEDMNELIDKCTWDWGEFNGTEGWMITGTNNGNEDVSSLRIFLPMTGYRNESGIQQSDHGYYWLGAREDSISCKSKALTITREEKVRVLENSWKGMNIRPVKTIWRQFNIPSNTTSYVDLRAHGPGYTIQVYDHGGPTGNYGNSCNGYLQITCAEGYKLNVTGRVNTEGCDYVRLYDVTPNGNVLVGSASGNNTTINLTSKGNVVLLGFQSDGSVVYSGLDMTVTIQKNNINYKVQVAETVGGSMTANVTEAHPEDTVILSSTPAPGYVLDHVQVKVGEKVLTLYEDDPRLFQSASSASRHYLMCDTTRVRDGNWWHDTAHFLMPYGDVVVTPYYTNTDTTIYLNMAGNGTTTVERKYLQRLIDNGMTQFQFYDYRGKNGNYYDNNVDGYMFLDAPVGYVMQISGTVWTEGGCDPLTVHDGYNTSYQQLVSAGGNPSSFNTTTHNNVAYLRFRTDGSNNGYAGYAAKVVLKPDTVTRYNIPYNTVLDITEEHMAWLLKKGITSMPVYDHGGPTGNYPNSCSGTLRIRVPEGYKMHVYGTVTSEGCDKLYVYDNEVQKIVCSGSNQTVDYTTESRCLKLYFYSDGSVVYSGIALTLDFIKDE